MLSPFTVTSERDTGYVATNTLAGTRLNTPVQDLGASISIYTKDFLNDLGVTNARELLIYGTNAETSGPGGNFSGAAGDINQAQVVADGPRQSSQGPARTRGLLGLNNARGYFRTSIPFDSYNIDAVTVNRGPNAILFGVGSPAGVVDYTPSKAGTTRNANRIEARYGNNNAVRGVLDFNRVLIPKKLGVRVIGLADDEEFNQRPAFEHQRRLFGAITYEPFRSTVVRANIEHGRHYANRPISTLPFKSYTEAWEGLGRPYFDWDFYDNPARNPNAATQNAQTVFFNSRPLSYLVGGEQRLGGVTLVYNNPADNVPAAAYIGAGHTPGTVVDAIRQNVFHPTINRDGAPDAPPYGWWYATRNISEVSGFYFGAPGGLAPAGIKTQTFTDKSAFDFSGRIIDETSRQMENYRAFTVSLEQRAWKDRLGFEFAYDRQRYINRRRNYFFQQGNTSHIRIELTQTLPDGTPNPNLGRPFAIYGQSNFGNAINDNESYRGTGFIKYDFKDLGPRAGFWFGRHAITGLAEQNAVESISYTTRLVSDDPLYNAINPAPDSFNRRPVAIVYMGPSILDGSPLRLSPIRVSGLEPGLKFDTNYFSAPAGSTAQGRFVKDPTTLLEINGGGSAGREVVKSQALVLQSHWLAEHFVTLFGWRRDEDFNTRQNIVFVPANPTKAHYGLGDFNFPSTPAFVTAKETKTYSGVLKWPQKLVRLPPGTALSVFANRAENFTPQANRTDGYGNPLASPAGKTKEYGFNLSLFHDKLILRANAFETSVIGLSFGSPAYNTAYNNAVLQWAQFWEQERNINPGIDRSADIALLFSALPANFRQLNQFVVTGSPATQNISANYQQLLTRSDTTNFTAKGREFELIYNPTKNWRILANISRQVTVQTDIAPGSREFINRMRPIWQQLSNRPIGNYPAGHVLGNPLPAVVTTIGSAIPTMIDVPLATTLASEGVASAEQRKWRVNLVSNYQFDRSSLFGGRLNGFGLGAAARWQDKLGIGYPISRDARGVVNVDIQHPYYAPDELNVDGWISYGRKIFRDRINWKIQLNVRNLCGDQALIAINAQPDGKPAAVRTPPERRWYVTNSFVF